MRCHLCPNSLTRRSVVIGHLGSPKKVRLCEGCKDRADEVSEEVFGELKREVEKRFRKRTREEAKALERREKVRYQGLYS